jgi:hypothetical protein
MDSWFLSATMFRDPGTLQRVAKPDFFGSADWQRCAGGRVKANSPVFFDGLWSLLSYDAKHHIALARATTDQCSIALFKAPPPPKRAADADLTDFGTASGLRIGSSYAKVLAIYGPPVKRGQRFVTSYSGSIHAIAFNQKHVELPERITLVIVDERVASISIDIDESGLF